MPKVFTHYCTVPGVKYRRGADLYLMVVMKWNMEVALVACASSLVEQMHAYVYVLYTHGTYYLPTNLDAGTI